MQRSSQQLLARLASRITSSTALGAASVTAAAATAACRSMATLAPRAQTATVFETPAGVVSKTSVSKFTATRQTTKATLNLANVGRRMFSSYPPHTVLNMPALSPTMEQGRIASWGKKPGDAVKPGDLLAEIETDKATVSFDSTEEGYIAKILVPAGTEIPVGTPVAILVEDPDSIAAFENYSAGGAAAPSAAAPSAAPAAAAPAAPAAPAAAAPSGPSCSNRGVMPLPGFDDDEKPTQAAEPQSNGRIIASPAAKAAAAERGIDLSQIQGTGPNRRIVKADVLEFTPAAKPAAAAASTTPAAAAAAAATSGAAIPAGDYVDIPLSQMRKVIAQRLSQSKERIPHYYITVECQMDALLKLRTELNKKLEADAKSKESATKLSVNDFIIKAAAAALKQVPQVNCSWQDTTIRQYNYVDISVAVATDAGLITPIIADADLKGLATISSEMKTLAKKARENKLQPHEFQGGTFTISNLGMYGVKHFSAIINPPQAGILAIGGTDVKVVPVPGAEADKPQFKTVQVMSVTASFDHRVVDGAVGAQWLAAFKGYIENPSTLLL